MRDCFTRILTDVALFIGQWSILTRSWRALVYALICYLDIAFMAIKPPILLPLKAHLRPHIDCSDLDIARSILLYPVKLLVVCNCSSHHNRTSVIRSVPHAMLSCSLSNGNVLAASAFGSHSRVIIIQTPPLIASASSFTWYLLSPSYPKSA